MHVAVIIPVHNEEEFLEGCLHALLSQTQKPDEIIVVDDNSTDNGPAIIQKLARNHQEITYVYQHSAKEHLPGAKVVRAFNSGFNKINPKWEFVLKMDADIILPERYFSELLKKFKNNPILGIAGGILEEEQEGVWKVNHPMHLTHVRGAIKMYRRECFEKIGGLRANIGWDTADELLAQFYGYETKTFKEIGVKHLRPVGKNYNPKAKKMQGQAWYQLRYGWGLTLLTALKMAWSQKKINIIFDTLRGYSHAKRKKFSFLYNKEVGIFVRKKRWMGVFDFLTPNTANETKL